MLTIRKCNIDDLPSILRLQEICFEHLDNADWLRRNTRETFITCLEEPSITLGAFDGNELAGVAILQICGKDRENLGYQLKRYPLETVANMKLVLVNPAYRGQHLQYELMKLCRKHAEEMGMAIMATTVHPDNIYSVRNITKCGYQFDSRQIKYGGLIRDLYYLQIGKEETNGEEK